jgi:hypothetical protein
MEVNDRLVEEGSSEYGQHHENVVVLDLDGVGRD